jgi:hypothetical protein
MTEDKMKVKDILIILLLLIFSAAVTIADLLVTS